MLENVPVVGQPGSLGRVLIGLRLRGMAPGRILLTAPRTTMDAEEIRLLEEEADEARLPITCVPELLRGQADGAAFSADGREKLHDAVARIEHGSYLVGKRFFDIIVSAAVLTLTAPLMAAIALALRPSIGSPVLFHQVRGGRHGRPFVMVKFRTMAETYDAAGALLPDTVRTPQIGRLLRRTRLDELPQFWNVLVGNMSIVGPRPLVAAELALLPDGGAERSSIRPGITGWAQVHGGQLLDLPAKVALDVWYARHASPTLDLRILLLTVLMVVRGERPADAALERIEAAICRGRVGEARLGQARADHRDHRSGRGLSGRAAAGQGLRGARREAARLLVQHRPDRPSLPGPARARRPLSPALWRPDRRHQPDPHRAGGAARRDLQPRRPEPRQGQLRHARIHRQRRRHRHAAPARGDPHPRARRHGPASTRRAPRSSTAPPRRRRARPRRSCRRAPTPRPSSTPTGSPATTARATACSPPTASCSTTRARCAARPSSPARSPARWPRSSSACRTGCGSAISTPGATGATPATMSRACGASCSTRRADDWVLATGEAHSVREFVERAFAEIGRELVWKGEGVDEKGIDRRTGQLLVEIDPRYFRPLEVDHLLGDAGQGHARAGLAPRPPASPSWSPRWWRPTSTRSRREHLAHGQLVNHAAE